MNRLNYLGHESVKDTKHMFQVYFCYGDWLNTNEACIYSIELK